MCTKNFYNVHSVVIKNPLFFVPTSHDLLFRQTSNQYHLKAVSGTEYRAASWRIHYGFKRIFRKSSIINQSSGFFEFRTIIPRNLRDSGGYQWRCCYRCPRSIYHGFNIYAAVPIQFYQWCCWWRAGTQWPYRGVCSQWYRWQLRVRDCKSLELGAQPEPESVRINIPVPGGVGRVLHTQRIVFTKFP